MSLPFCRPEGWGPGQGPAARGHHSWGIAQAFSFYWPLSPCVASEGHARSQHMSFCLESKAREELGLTQQAGSTQQARDGPGQGKQVSTWGVGAHRWAETQWPVWRRRELSGWAMICVETAECFKQGLSFCGCTFQMLTLEKESRGLQCKSPSCVLGDKGSGFGARW